MIAAPSEVRSTAYVGYIHVCHLINVDSEVDGHRLPPLFKVPIETMPMRVKVIRQV